MHLPLGDDQLPLGQPHDHGLGTIGYQNAEWGHRHLAQPDGDLAGLPWMWRRWQVRFLEWWYAFDPETGRFLYRRGQLVLPKGGGKSPFASAYACLSLGGPTRLVRSKKTGAWIGVPQPSPWVQIAAVSQDQTNNTMSLVIPMLGEGSASSVMPGLDLGLTRIFTANGRLEPVTASAPTREGQRLTDAVLDETHLWTPENGGVKLASALRRNLGKMKGRSIETTNCWQIGVESVAESTAEVGEKARDAKEEDAGILRFHPVANVPDISDMEHVREQMVKMYEDMPWIDVDRVMQEIRDPATTTADARRFYFNQVSLEDNQLVDPRHYDACKVEDRLRPKDKVTLGFDGSIRDDATALVACRVKDRFFVPLGIWERPDTPEGRHWEVDRLSVDQEVANAFDTFDVVGFYADVEHFESYVDMWSATYGPELLVKASPSSWVGWDMRGRLQQSTNGNERLYTAIENHQIKHDGHQHLRRHVLNVYGRPSPRGFGTSFGKVRKDSPRKVDGYAAMLLADMARYDIEMSGKNKTVDRRVMVLSR